MPIGEFELIQRYFTGLGNAPGVVLGVGDDGAVLEIPVGQQLVAVIDTVVSGVHFLPDADPFDIGWRALAVNLSDLAAMGAEPRWFTLALTLPSAEPGWLARFAEGLRVLALQAGVALVGGDTTRGPLTVTVQAEGLVPAGQALRRRGARAGDRIWVSGYPGEAAAGLAVLQGQVPATGDARRWSERFLRPEPRIILGKSLRGMATACIDVSDGLAQDLGHLLAASGVGGRLSLERLPISPALRTAGGARCLDWVLAGGDDYELCFTVPAGVMPPPADCPLACIGEVVAGAGLVLLDAVGCEQALPAGGYRHFSGGV